MKDDRTDKTAEGERRTKLFRAVMSKVAGTLAGLTLAERLNDPSLHVVAGLSQCPAIEVVLFWVEPQPPAAVSTLRRTVRRGGKTTLQQRLAAKLKQWGLPFSFYNLTDHPPIEWQVRDLKVSPSLP